MSQTWVYSSTSNKAKLLTLCCVEGKHNIYCRCQISSMGLLRLKKPELSDWFQGRVFFFFSPRPRWGRGGTVYVINSCTILQLFVDDITTWGHRACQLSGSSPLWGYSTHNHHAVIFFHLVGVLLNQFRNMHQVLLSMYFGKKLKILWLHMGDLLFKYLPVFLVKLYYYHYMFTCGH